MVYPGPYHVDNTQTFDLRNDSRGVLGGDHEFNQASETLESIPSLPMANEPSDMRTSISNGTIASVPDHRCLQPGCTHSGTFSRYHELKRHIVSKHTREKPFRCPVHGCFKGSRAPAFARADKLTSHMRAVHGLASLAHCPFETCDAQLPLDLLDLHIELSPTHRYKDLKYRTRISKSERRLWNRLVAVGNASNGAYMRCPYWRCRKQFHRSELNDHVLSHNTEAHNDMQETLNGLNYILSRKGCVHGNDTPSLRALARNTCSCPVTAVYIGCPVCGDTCQDKKALTMHLTREHMATQSTGMLAKFDGLHPASALFQYPPSNPKAFEAYWLQGIFGYQSKCPSCREMLWKCDCEQLPFIRSQDEIIRELRPFRQQLLRLLPEFRYITPVFEDII